MTSARLRVPFVLLSLVFSVFHLAAAEPVQFCRFGNHEKPNPRSDFCMGAVLHLNTSTSSYDLLLSYTQTRLNGSRLGWTAIGLGKIMDGSLMFIVYGDPLSHQAPLVSIRRATGDHQPTLVTRVDVGGVDLKVVSAVWVNATGTFGGTDGHDDYLAEVHLICYACTLWPWTLISATAKSQPWIWAWNPDQDFPVYTFDAHLEMHTHGSASGGYGSFYVDMARSVNAAPGLVSLPPIRPHIAMLGTSETPAGLWAAFSTFVLNPTMHLHALLMGSAFFVFFPTGVLAMRSGAKAFRYHWVLQLAGSTTILCGMILGLLIRRKINTVHQCIGIAVAVATGLQGILGWRHHVQFLQTDHRTWLSDAHVLLGKLVMVAGWINVVSGMMLYGYSLGAVIIVGALGFAEMAGIIFWLWMMSAKENVV